MVLDYIFDLQKNVSVNTKKENIFIRERNERIASNLFILTFMLSY